MNHVISTFSEIPISEKYFSQALEIFSESNFLKNFKHHFVLKKDFPNFKYFFKIFSKKNFFQFQKHQRKIPNE